MTEAAVTLPLHTAVTLTITQVLAWKMEAEQLLRASGVPYVVVRVCSHH